MKKLLSTTVLAIALLGLPLLGRAHLFWNTHLLVIAFFFYLLFFTQPAFQAMVAGREATTDRYSFFVILAALILTLSGGIVDWAYFNGEAHRMEMDRCRITGLLMLFIGSAIRIWAIVCLGTYFSNTVRFGTEHQLITKGPYQFIRHPSYLGAYLAILGSTMFLSSIRFFLVGMVLMLLAYHYRIVVEERAMMNQFPNEFPTFRSKTKKLIPFIY